ncbi:sugar-binding protein [bacterium]
MITERFFHKIKSNKLFYSVLTILLLVSIGNLYAHTITFDEQRYKDVAGTKLYRGGPNTLFDTQLGLDFYVAYGQMEIVNFQSGGLDNYMLYFTPFISSPPTTDPLSRIVITFNELQRYVRINLGTDGTPVHANPYLRVSYYKSTQPSNALYFEDGGGNIEYTNTTDGIKMLIVDTKFAENDIFELEFYALTEELPDIIVTNIEIMDAMGPDLSYKVTVQNIGTGATTGEFKNRIYLSTDATITSADHQINDWNWYEILAAGQSKTSYDLTSTVTGLPPGEYYMGVIADGKEVITESDETNNTLANLITKVIIPDGGSGGDPDFVLDVPMAQMAPVIDGVMDPIWYSACSVPMERSNTTDAVAPDNWLDTFARFKMMYDDDHYYVFIQAHDDIINTSSSNSYENDSFEIYFDGDNSKNDQATGYDGNDVQMRYVYGQTSDNSGNAPNSICQYLNTDNGYNCEIRIPVQDMTFNLNPDHTFGFDIQFNDNDQGGRDHLLKWWNEDNNSWQNPGLFGTAHTTDYMAADPMYVLQAPGTPIIDGVMDDAAWDNIPWFSDNTFVVQNGGAPLSPPFDINNINGWNDCRFNYKMMWQGSILYFYADVFDDIIDTGHGDFWMNDGFQIFIDGNNDKTSLPDANDAEYNSVYTTTPTGDVAFTQTTSGWTMEMQMNLGANPGISPAIDDLMGIDVSVNDNDGGGRDLWSRWWSEDDVAWNNPSLRGTIKFTGLTVDVEDNKSKSVIQDFHLAQNYPNPFNPSTTIRYSVPITSSVTLTIYDLLGKEITTLVNEIRTPGEYSVVWDSEGQAAGIYLARLNTGDFTETKKLILQK